MKRVLQSPSLIERVPFLLRSAQADVVLKRTKLFFIVSIGRSGTTFLANLLQLPQNYAVYHEILADRNALVRAYWSEVEAADYLRTYRNKVIAARIQESGCQVYGEVNSYLRHHISALKNLWQPQLLHLVRNGQDVVRSAMNRNIYTAKDKHHSGKITPRAGDPWAAEWHNMHRFERVCWYWARTNDEIASHNLPIARFEDVVSSYASFAAQVLDVLGLDLPRELWEAEVNKPLNPSQHKDFPAWPHWSDQQKAQFVAICGPTMARFGYEI